MRCFQAELSSRFLPSSYAGHVNLAGEKPGRFKRNCKYGSPVEIIIFRDLFNISVLPKYRVNYYDYCISGRVGYNVIVILAGKAVF